MRPFAATKNEPLCEYSILSKDTCTFNLPSVNQMSRTLNDVTEEFKFCFSCKIKNGSKMNHPRLMLTVFAYNSKKTFWHKKHNSYVQGYQLSLGHVHFAAFTEVQQNDKSYFWL